MAAAPMTIEQRRPLAEMILDAWGEGATPYRDLAKRARDRGHEISSSQLNNYANGHVTNIPKRALIDAIAVAIDRPREEVLAAVLEEFMGYQPEQYAAPGGSTRLVALPPDASPEDIAEARRLVDAWWEARRGRQD